MPRRLRALATQSSWTIRLLGAVVWVAVVLVRLLREDRGLWFARDDVVITLSHARNAADFGSIGISPIGDRTEGFSSPLHFGVAYVLEVIGDWGYGTLTMIVLMAALVVIGLLVTDIFLIRFVDVGANQLSAWSALAASSALAITVAASWTTTGWIGSGMENPIVIACGFAVIAATVRAMSSDRALFGLALAIAAFGLSRVELAAFSLPLATALAVLLLHEASPTPRRRNLMFAAGGVAGAAIVGVHLARRAYFGAWLPNTAVAQQRVEGAAQVEALIWFSLLAATAIAVPWLRSRASDRAAKVKRLALVGALVAGARLLWLVATEPLPGSYVRFAAFPPLLVLGALLLGSHLLTARPERKWHPVDLVAASIAAAPIAQYVIAGPARMHEFRVLSLAVPFVGLVVVGQLTDAVRRRRALVGDLRRATAPVALAGVAALGVVAWNDGPTYLNWDIQHAPWVLDVATDFAATELGNGAMPILANADLGKVSFDKSVIIVDLGRLGDPALAELADRAPEVVVAYLRDVAAPDVVELHGGFTCSFAPLVFDRPEYRLASGAEPTADQRCGGGRAFSFWHRADAGDELALATEIAASADPAAVVRGAAGACTGADGGVFRCEPVRRALQRAAVPLRDAGTYDEAIDELSVSPSWSLSEPLLRRDAGWGPRAADAYLALTTG